MNYLFYTCFSTNQMHSHLLPFTKIIFIISLMNAFIGADIIPLKKDLVLYVSFLPISSISWCGVGSKFAVGSEDSTVYFYDIHSLSNEGRSTS